MWVPETKSIDLGTAITAGNMATSFESFPFPRRTPLSLIRHHRLWATWLHSPNCLVAIASLGFVYTDASWLSRAY